MTDDVEDALTYSILGYRLSLPEIAQSTFDTLRDKEAGQADETACDHRVGLPYQDGYACGQCHSEFEIGEFEEVWVNMENGITRVDIKNSNLGELFG